MDAQKKNKCRLLPYEKEVATGTFTCATARVIKNGEANIL